MTLTREFKVTIQARAERDPEFRIGLFKESINCFLLGDLDTGKLLLRDYINATVGFEELGNLVNKSPKSIMRMFSAEGNPRADNLFAVLSMLQQQEGIHLTVEA